MVAILLAAFCLRAQENTSSNRFFLPQNPIAAAYVLGRLSNQELIAAPRSEFVYVALLERKGLERKYRLEALEGLSRIRKTDAVAEAIRGLDELDKKGAQSTEALEDLGQILLRLKPEALAPKRSEMAKLATNSQMPLTRQIGWAAMVTADQSFEASWKSAEANQLQLIDLLLGVRLSQPLGLRTELYERTEALVRKADSSELNRAAMSGLVAIPGHDIDNFKILVQLIEAGTETDAAIGALLQVPQTAWSREQIPMLETNLVAHLQSIPVNERSEPAFATALQLATEAATLLPESSARPLVRMLRDLGPTIFVLHAVYEQMRFDKQLLVVEPDKPVAITLQNDDAMPHNLAILAPGALEEIGQTAEKMPAEPDADGRLYVPASPKVLHATKLVPPGQAAQLAFRAPAEPGEYPFVCTFPGHWRRMVGTVAVVADVDAYLAAHVSLQPKLTEWKLGDLAPELEKAGSTRDLIMGKELFSKLACIQCHQLGAHGYAYGPNLTDVFARYKNDRASVLEQILEPSKLIDERYKNYNFELNEGEPVTGMVLKEDAENVTVQTGPADSLVQVLKKSDINKRSPQVSSPMPIGLLNALSKDQILDLMAYLQTGGDLPEQHHHNP